MLNPSDYMSAGPAIIARLEAQVTAVKSVITLPDMVAALNSTVALPALVLVYAGDDVESRAAGRNQVITQTWAVGVAVKNVLDTRGVSNAMWAAGALKSDANVALTGWRPTTAHTALWRVDDPEPFYLPGKVLLPLRFTTKFEFFIDPV